MRVSVNHTTETKGFIAKTTYHVVELTVEFSDEERHIIDTQDLRSLTILERPPSAEKQVYENDDLSIYWLNVYGLLQGTDRYYCRNMADAKEYEAAVMEKMPILKEYIMQNAEIEEKSKTVEF